MKKIQLVLATSFLALNIANAATPCDGFQVHVKNNLQDNLMISTIKLNGAEIQPSGLQTLDSKAETAFTVSGSNANTPMTGEFIFHTISLPMKTVHLNFNLTNELLLCSHVDHSTNDNYAVSTFRMPGQVTYTIGH